MHDLNGGYLRENSVLKKTTEGAFRGKPSNDQDISMLEIDMRFFSQNSGSSFIVESLVLSIPPYLWLNQMADLSFSCTISLNAENGGRGRRIQEIALVRSFGVVGQLSAFLERDRKKAVRGQSFTATLQLRVKL
ncbi:uncharacterized protein LOC129293434 isoform X2 [Prosopis cineraria]|uniref:uncharacterized protein LOC129293434 isoform X2 n=1 Tax=Prosopis cineraria TaxID=364024 RepID=UPI00240EF4C1|nr:uncharacterized protein LOC129293434 isoform X2 [Prosopis cineraria]